jgi:phage-related protein
LPPELPPYGYPWLEILGGARPHRPVRDFELRAPKSTKKSPPLHKVPIAQGFPLTNFSIIDLLSNLDAQTGEHTDLDFRGNGLEVLSSFPLPIKETLGFNLRRLQDGERPACQFRPMPSVGPGIFELKDQDESTWYRVIYLTEGDGRHLCSALL